MTDVLDRSSGPDASDSTAAPSTAGPSTAAPSTAAGPTLTSTVRSARGPVALGLALVLVGTLVGVLSTTGQGGRLDPDSYAPSGSRAVAELLRGAGVAVQRLDTVEAVEAVDGVGRVLVIPEPAALAPSELQRLSFLDAGLLVVGADDDQLAELDLDAEVRGNTGVQQRRPACDLPAAVTAGDVDLGGLSYRGMRAAAATGCYAVGGEATLLRLTGQDATLLGAGDLLTNDRLDDRGNAALALGLLGDAEQVLWLVPRPGRPIAEGDQPALSELVADGFYSGALQLLVVVAVLALWRARRLGRVVEEPLPVVVRASEAVEGRGRLYRAAGARGQAAESLRAATRDRLARRLGLGLSTDRVALVTNAAERTGVDPSTVDALLYGAAPAGDDSLVRLCDDLQNLESTLTREVAGP